MEHYSKSAPLTKNNGDNSLSDRVFQNDVKYISHLKVHTNDHSIRNFVLSKQTEAMNNNIDYDLEEIDLGYIEPCSTSAETDNSNSSINQRNKTQKCFEDLTSPHQPPYEYNYISPIKGKKTLRETVIDSRNRRFLPSDNYFHDYVEDRLAFWRPSDSQFNIDDTIAGLHPYQQELNLNKGALKFLTSYFYNDNIKNNDLEKQIGKQILSDSNNYKNIKKDTLNLKKNQNQNNKYPITPDILNLLNNIELKPNSSKSILSKKLVFNKNIFNNEPSPTKDPIYTATGIPLWDYEVNFETHSHSDFKQFIYGYDSSNIMNSMDQEVLDLIDGVDNFIFDCFATTWKYCKSIFSYCRNLF